MLTLSAACVTVLAVGDTAWADASEPVRRATANALPSPRPRSNPTAGDNTFAFDVFIDPVQDLVAIDVTVTNTTSTADTFQISYTDNKTGLQSRVHNLSLDGGATDFVELYGGLNRSFDVKVCRVSSGNCIVLGSLAPIRK